MPLKLRYVQVEPGPEPISVQKPQHWVGVSKVQNRQIHNSNSPLLKEAASLKPLILSNVTLTGSRFLLFHTVPALYPEWIRNPTSTRSPSTSSNHCIAAAEHLGLLVISVASFIFQTSNIILQLFQKTHVFFSFYFFPWKQNLFAFAWYMAVRSTSFIHFLVIWCMNKGLKCIPACHLKFCAANSDEYAQFLSWGTVSFSCDSIIWQAVLHWQYCTIFLSACKLWWQSHKHKLAGILSQSNVC